MTYVFAIFMGIDLYLHDSSSWPKLACLGIFFVLAKLDDIRDAGRPRWRLTWNYREGWKWDKSVPETEAKP